MHRVAVMSLAVLFVVAGSGCSLMAPKYTASMENVQELKDAGDYTAKVGQFHSQPGPGNANPISLRGNSLLSPYADSYANYVAEAIKQELTLAGKLSPDAVVEVSGVLLKNDLDAATFGMGQGDIEARFVVKKSGQVRYDKVVSAHYEWESSFAGAIAIPRAQQAYPELVQKLLATLYADRSFVQALK
ncbi:MAG TPA: hypothetical protein VLV32_04245 [Burkholderiales bacterium]|nr:hypothetical protein [Burkholderiales bacterium]